MPRFSLLTSIIGAGGLLFLSAAPGGCGSEKQLVIADAPYTGPILRVESSGQHHVVVLSTSGAGWAVQMDQTRQQFERTEVFITARRPNPAVVQSGAVQDHLVATNVPTTTAASIYVRILEPKDEPSKMPYRLAQQIAGTTPHASSTP